MKDISNQGDLFIFVFSSCISLGCSCIWEGPGERWASCSSGEWVCLVVLPTCLPKDWSIDQSKRSWWQTEVKLIITRCNILQTVKRPWKDKAWSLDLGSENLNTLHTFQLLLFFSCFKIIYFSPIRWNSHPGVSCMHRAWDPYSGCIFRAGHGADAQTEGRWGLPHWQRPGPRCSLSPYPRHNQSG